MRIVKSLCIVLAAVALSACGKIHTGHVGIRTDWNGKVEVNPEAEGFYTAWTSHVDEYTTKEIAVSLDKMTPKAKDQLILKELDVTVYYQTSGTAIRGLHVKRTGMSSLVKDTGNIEVWLPAYGLVQSVAKGAVADVVSKHDSLTIHKEREQLAAESKLAIQTSLDLTDPGAFTVTRVVVRDVKTDESIENNIRAVIAKEKDIEQARYALQAAQINAQAIRMTGEALTPLYVSHEYNQALMKFADKGGTVVLDGSGSSKMLNLANAGK